MKLESNNPKIASQQFENMSFLKPNHTFKGIMTRVTYEKVPCGLFVLYKGVICHDDSVKKHLRIDMDSDYPRLDYVKAMVNFGIISQQEFDEHKKDVEDARKRYLKRQELLSVVKKLKAEEIRPPKKLLKILEKQK